MKCPRCRHQNPPHAKFCEECATRLGWACANCGTRLSSTAKFCPECGHPAGVLAGDPRFPSPEAYTPKHLAEKILTSKSVLEGERKQVTVLFADMKGSMELLADRDPEDARKLLDPVLERMMEAVHRYEGTVNQVMGDGIMALFGAPLAHEDHAVRACYAALRMQESLNRYAEEARRSQGLTVRIRIGLNSGEVVVRAVGSDLRMDYTAVGQTTHLAARMEQLADPGTILLTADTFRLAEGYIEVKALGTVPVKGLSEPVELYELTGVGLARRRFEATAIRGLTRFVGREAELDQLRKALEQAGRGHGQVVAVVGEPGVGKSRLYWEFTHSHRTQGWLIVESGSVSYGKATPYLPVIDLLKAYFQIESHDETRKVREKATGKLLTLDRALEPVLLPLLALLDVLVEDAQWQGLDPPQRRQRTLEAVKRLLLRESQLQPLLLVFEDLHWIDSETQAVLDSLVDSLPTTRLLLLVNYRPEYQHGWGHKAYYNQLRLDPLPAQSAEELLNALLGDDPTLQPLRQVLVEQTEGNPFFLEETVRTLIETRVLAGERERYRLTKPLDAIQVPATVQAVLAARIDRLPLEEKTLLQTAAVIGKDVPFNLLQAIAELADEQLRHGLTHLQAAEFLYETNLFPELEYTFKHALTHEVTYESLLQERRRALHARIVDAFERLYPDRMAEQVDRLAHHSFRGEVWEKSFRYCREAAARAFARSAHAQALTHVDRSLEALEHLGDVSERKTAELELLTQRGAALRALRGYAAPEVEKVYLKARELCREVGDTPDRFRMEWQQMQFFLVRADLHAASELATSLLAHAERRQDRTLLIDAHLANGMTLFHQGDFAAARDHLERGVALYRPESDRPHLFTHGQNPGVFCLSYLAWTLWFLGYADQAKAHADMAVGIAKQKAHPFTHVSALTFATRVYQCRRDLDRVRTVAREVVSLSRDRGFAYYEAQGLIHEGWALVLMEEDEAGLPRMFDGYRALEGTGTVLGLQGALVQLAEACKRIGLADKALWALDRAENPEQGRGTRCWQAEIARLRAELVGEGPDPDPGKARRWYLTALQTARRQRAKSLELRVALSYAKTLRSEGRWGEARKLLEEVTSAFTEGGETVELREARALLRA